VAVRLGLTGADPDGAPWLGARVQRAVLAASRAPAIIRYPPDVSGSYL